MMFDQAPLENDLDALFEDDFAALFGDGASGGGLRATVFTARYAIKDFERKNVEALYVLKGFSTLAVTARYAISRFGTTFRHAFYRLGRVEPPAKITKIERLP